MQKAWQFYVTTSWLRNTILTIFYNLYNPSGLKTSTLSRITLRMQSLLERPPLGARGKRVGNY
jgi:hypothetical protein